MTCKTDEKAALDDSAKAQKDQLQLDQNDEIQAQELSNRNTMAIITNQLAANGTLDGSTQAAQYMADQKRAGDKLLSTINQKYAIKRANIDADTKQKLLDAIDKKIATMRADFDSNTKALQAAQALGVDLFKELGANARAADANKTQKDIADQKAKIDQEQNDITKAYNEGKLTIDAYNAQIAALDEKRKEVETNSNVALNAAQAGKLNAETAQIKSEMGPQMSYADFLTQKSIENRANYDPTNPDLIAEYNSKYNSPKVSTIKKNLTAASQAYLNVIQEMLKTGEVKDLQTAQKMAQDAGHPEVVPLIKGSATQAVEDITAALQAALN